MAMATRSMKAIVIVLGLGVPVAYFVLGRLVELRLAPYEQVRPLLSVFGGLGWLDLFIVSPVAIVLLVRSFRRPALEAAFAVILLLPVFVALWFVGIATLSGALGNPF